MHWRLWQLLVLALLMTLPLGCIRNPGPPHGVAGTPTVTKLIGEWNQFFPCRYGNSRNPGGQFLGNGCFVQSPDGHWRVTLAPAETRSGYDLRICQTGDAASTVFFRVSSLEPDPTFSYLVCRAVWAGHSEGVYATIQPEEGNQYAQTFYIDLAGSANAIASRTRVGSNTVLAPVPGTDLFLITDLAKPESMHLVNTDGAISATYAPKGHGLLVFEDASSDGVLLSQVVDATKASPMYLGPLAKEELALLGEGWCPRYRPGGRTIAYLRDVPDGLELVELAQPSGAMRILASLTGITEVKDCLWESADSLLILTGTDGLTGDTYRVTLNKPK